MIGLLPIFEIKNQAKVAYLHSRQRQACYYEAVSDKTKLES